VAQLFARLEERRSQTANTLSGGEQQILAIGRAPMTNPKILDEATEGLVPVVRQEIWTAIHELKRSGLSILLIGKPLKELAAVADRCFILEGGRTVWTAPLPSSRPRSPTATLPRGLTWTSSSSSACASSTAIRPGSCSSRATSRW
jgi:branched-chain amino acid transport system ATP-binding protein